MLTPEIALFASAGAVLLALSSCLLMLNTRRQLNKRLDEIRLELDVHLSANHEMAKHLRALQKKGLVAESTQSTYESDRGYRDLDVEERAYRDSRTEDRRHSRNDFGVRANNVRDFEVPAREEGLSLAEKLGLSQSEADIITHLRPHKRGLRETV